ncbi:hypothetical protein ZHAS_00006156 [Anopheles sinensis]|uniref:Uncharacterized protein n=1 Tax=Anopheles sinensis TaxID=74873 RepID=A0A084VL77_ANOSI|nr:hypothetical protein ZHAS_00006156 [Anopheles sinensis]
MTDKTGGSQSVAEERRWDWSGAKTINRTRNPPRPLHNEQGNGQREGHWYCPADAGAVRFPSLGRRFT